MKVRNKLQFVQKLEIMSFRLPPVNFREKSSGGSALICLLLIHQCGMMQNTKLLMTPHTHTHTYTQPDSCTNRRHHLLGTHLNKLRTKHWRREKAENWITMSPSFPLFFPLPVSLLHVRQWGSFCSPPRDGLIQPWTPKRRRGVPGWGGGILPWGGGK